MYFEGERASGFKGDGQLGQSLDTECSVGDGKLRDLDGI